MRIQWTPGATGKISCLGVMSKGYSGVGVMPEFSCRMRLIVSFSLRCQGLRNLIYWFMLHLQIACFKAIR